jgi:Icc protein
MLKLVWLSDPHFSAEGDVLGHDPRVRLRAAVSHINAHHSDAAFCVISGDMVNRGTVADYAALAEILETLKIPYFPMVGNHDDRQLLRQHLAVPGDSMAEFVQYSLPAEDALIVNLDTQKTGFDAGEFCEKRLRWLDDTLSGAHDLPVIIFMHHPPMPLGLPMQDTENMEQGARFLDLLQKHACVRYLCIGHVHRPVTGTVRGIPFATMRSVLYQAPAPQPAWDWHSFAPSAEAPNLGIVTISDMGINLQYHQFCPFETGTT